MTAILFAIRLSTILFLPAVAFSACRNSNAPSSPQEPKRAVNATEQPEGERTVEGRVEISKGAAFVGEFLVPSEAMNATFGSNWKGRVEGALVRIRGTTERYICGRDEQCLQAGSIPRFRTIAKFEVLCPNGRPRVVALPCANQDLASAIHCPGRECRDGTVWNGTTCVPECESFAVGSPSPSASSAR